MNYIYCFYSATGDFYCNNNDNYENFYQLTSNKVPLPITTQRPTTQKLTTY